MIRKHIAHLATETMKYFFNIDHSICHHWMITMFLLFSIARIFMKSVADIFHDGILTVQYDAYLIKTKLAELKAELEKKEQFETLVKRLSEFVGEIKLVRS